MVARYRSETRDSVERYVERIAEAWSTSFRAIISVGRLLLKAKEELPHGSFQEMIEEKLPFGTRTAQKLMEIARDPVITNPTHESHLPRCWTTLERLAQIPEERLEQLLNSGRIGPDTSRREADAILDQIRLEGVLDYSRLRESIRQLIRFRAAYPRPDHLAPYLGDDEEETIEPDDLQELSRWLRRLCAPYRAAIQAEEREHST